MPCRLRRPCVTCEPRKIGLVSIIGVRGRGEEKRLEGGGASRGQERPPPMSFVPASKQPHVGDFYQRYY